MKKQQLIIAAIIVAIIAVWYGFGTQVETITQCKVTATKYVNAEFSEYTTEIDMNGDLVSGMDYWSEIASETLVAVTIDGVLVDTSHDFDVRETNSRFFVPPMPTPDSYFRQDPDFDNYSKVEQYTLKVSTRTQEGTFSSFTSSVSNNVKCINAISMDTTIKAWYGITYNSDF